MGFVCSSLFQCVSKFSFDAFRLGKVFSFSLDTQVSLQNIFSVKESDTCRSFHSPHSERNGFTIFRKPVLGSEPYPDKIPVMS